MDTFVYLQGGMLCDAGNVNFQKLTRFYIQKQEQISEVVE